MTYWLKKKNKNIHVFEVLIFLKTYCYCQSQEILFKSSDDILLANFALPNSITLVEVREVLEIFFIDHFAGDIGNKKIAGKYSKNYCISLAHPILGESVNTDNSIIPWFI